MILGTCSMSTGHWSMHAPHVVHAHSVSSAMVPPKSGRSPPFASTAVATSSGAIHDGWK